MVNELSEQSIRAELAEMGRCLNLRLHICDSIGSTNDYVMSLSDEVDDGFIACVANHQLNGRGRHGAVWQSPAAANIYLSLGAPMKVELLQSFSGLSLACGVVVAKYLDELGIAPRLKWPNDILVGGEKLAGILIETRVRGGAIFAVIGIGMNVDMSDALATNIDQPWTDLRRCLAGGNEMVNRNKLIAGLLAALVSACELYRLEGFDAFVEDWQTYDVLKGKKVRIVSDGQETLAEARGVAKDGSLRVRINGDEKNIYAADVKIRLEN